MLPNTHNRFAQLGRLVAQQQMQKQAFNSLGNMLGGIANKGVQSPIGQGVLGAASAGYNRLPESIRQQVGRVATPGFFSGQQPSVEDLQNLGNQAFQNKRFEHGAYIDSRRTNSTRSGGGNHTDQSLEDINSYSPGVAGSPLSQLRRSLVMGDKLPSRTFAAGSPVYQHLYAGSNYGETNSQTPQYNQTLTERLLPAKPNYPGLGAGLGRFSTFQPGNSAPKAAPAPAASQSPAPRIKSSGDYTPQVGQGTHGNYFRRLPMNRPAKPVAKAPVPAKPVPAKPVAKATAKQQPPAPQMPDMRPVGNALRSAGSGLQSLMQKIQAYQKQQAKPQPKPRTVPQNTGPIVDDYWSNS